MPTSNKSALTLLAEYDEAAAKYEAAREDSGMDAADDEAHDAYLDTIFSLVPDMAAALRDVTGYQSSTTTYDPS